MGARRSTPPFHRLVYRLVRRVPRGKVVTYGQVAAILGQPRGARALGRRLRRSVLRSSRPSRGSA